MMTDARTAARSDTGRVREGNEDRWTARRMRGVVLLAVADGVGGAEAGERASASAVETLAERFFAVVRRDGVREALATAIRDANDAVVAFAAEGGFRSATTLVAAAIRRGEATVANLGDSRAYLLRGRTIRQITTDHSGARPNEITRFIGDERGVQADVFVERLRAGDRLVLCSDGLTRHVTDAEIATLARRGPPARAASTLVDLANERGGEDNITVLVHEARHSALARAAVAAAVLLAIAGLTALGAYIAVLRAAG